MAVRRDRDAAQEGRGSRSEGRAIPRQDQSLHRHQQHLAVEPAARRIQRAAGHGACAEIRCRGEGAADPRGAEIGRTDRVLRHRQFRADAAAVRAARHAARAACRAILDAARPASAHQGIACADRRPRPADARRGRSACALARKRCQAGERQGRRAVAPGSTSSSGRRRRPTSRTCSCARSNAMRSRSAICSNPISPNTARRPRATASAQRRADARIISTAVVSNTPAWPRKLPIILVVGAGDVRLVLGLRAEQRTAWAQCPRGRSFRRAGCAGRVPHAARDRRRHRAGGRSAAAAEPAAGTGATGDAGSRRRRTGAGGAARSDRARSHAISARPASLARRITVVGASHNVGTTMAAITLARSSPSRAGWC